MHAHSLRRRLSAAALVVTAAGSLAACAIEPETLRPYNPSQGVNTESAGMKVRNLVVVSDPAGSYLSGDLNTATNDSLVGAGATQINADGSDGDDLGVTGSAVSVQAGQPLQLRDSGIGFSGKPQAGLTARVNLNFEHAGVVSLVVPVVSSTWPDYATVTPKRTAQSSSASASPSTSAPASSASASPSTSAPASSASASSTHPTSSTSATVGSTGPGEVPSASATS